MRYKRAERRSIALAILELPTLDATANFGHKLGQLLQGRPMPVFLRGELGAGKTTLVRHLASALPGAEKAEVSSPSFNICNYYPTSPEIVHCDLHRCKNGIPDEVEVAIFSPNKIALVEWANYLPMCMKPAFFLDILLSVRNNTRFATLSATGDSACGIMQRLLGKYSQ